MNTRDYRTPQAFVYRNHPKLNNGYLIALDAGYSSMKVFAENKYFYFPTFVKKMGDDMLDIVQDNSIMYEDLETGERYMLGQVAQNMVSAEDTSDTEGEWFSRKRYTNKKFHILCKAAIAIAIMGREDDRDIIIQTGLPTDYMGDIIELKKAICKDLKFKIRLGNQPWQVFDKGIEINPDNINVIPQPAGSLYSAMINKNGEMIADYIAKSSTLVADIGFGTFDFFGVDKGKVKCKASITDVGMLEVLKHLSKKIREEFNEDIHVSAMQYILEKGTVQCIEEDEEENLTEEERPIAGMLQEASKEVFTEAFDPAKSTTNNFRGYDNLIIAGGTGRAWIDYFNEKLKGMKSLNVIPCNKNDEIPFILGNVRGYYMFRYRAGVHTGS